VLAVKALRERFPCWGKMKLVILLGARGLTDFESTCRERGILLFELPPRSPKLNGRVERANRTFREEYYDCTTDPPTVAGRTPGLRRTEHIYNHLRPHQALGYLTPAQALVANFNIHPEEVLSRKS